MTTTKPPIQPVEKPILCSPFEPPGVHWEYDRETGTASRMPGRRPAEYWYKTKEQLKGQSQFEFAEGREPLKVVNALREDVGRWRESGWEGAERVTKELLRHWTSGNRDRRLFFCQREAVETVVYVTEILKGRGRTRFAPRFSPAELSLLTDPPADPDLMPLTRLGCKMATGSGKTVVMGMLIAWALCNRGVRPNDERFPAGVLVCCPNLTVKERLQVLRPDRDDNYYAMFDLVPVRLREAMAGGRVVVENWHRFAPAGEHTEGGKSYAVVNKGQETPDAFARRVLGELYGRLPLMVLNDEAHHCYRPKPADGEDDGPVTGEERKTAQEANEEATVWVGGLDRINNHAGGRPAGQTAPGVSICVDLSATPFYIKGSGHAEGSPFPWLVSDFGLVDAIESGIVKIPRIPVSDTTGRPEAHYFRLWKNVRDRLTELGSGNLLPGKAKKPKPEAVYREAEAALKQLAGQWVERYRQIAEARPGQEQVPPVLIVVCDNTDIAEVVYRRISGEEPLETATADEVEADDEGDEPEDAPQPGKGARGKGKQRFSYGHGVVFPEYFQNTPELKRTIRIDSELLGKAESEDPTVSRKDAAEALRRVVSTVGKRGEPGEHVRCVVSVAMLTEGWDANNVTHILGLRAFGSQLLCEQVVGRGLRRMDYTPDPKTGLLTEEYVDVYGIPFTVVPFKGRPVNGPTPDDRPKNHVLALPERAGMEMRFPVVEGYAFALQRNQIKCDIASMEPMIVEPNREPTATFLQPTVGYQEGRPATAAPFGFVEQDREEYYRHTHVQQIQFEIARRVVERVSGDAPVGPGKSRGVLRLRSRHQLFPQVLRIVQEFCRRKIDLRGADARELGLRKYAERMVELLSDRIVPDDSEGEPPLLPVLNRYKPIGTTGEVDFKTVRPCHGTQKSHVNQVVLDNSTWESSAAFRLEQSDAVKFYARNDHLGLVIPYEFQGNDHHHEPDFLVRLRTDETLLLEIKGFEDAQTTAKHEATKRWVEAVNNAQEHGRWRFHVCREPQRLEAELRWMMEQKPSATGTRLAVH